MMDSRATHLRRGPALYKYLDELLLRLSRHRSHWVKILIQSLKLRYQLHISCVADVVSRPKQDSAAGLSTSAFHEAYNDRCRALQSHPDHYRAF